MNTVDPLDEIAENFDSISGSEENLDSISNYSEEDFTARYGSVSCGSEDEWMSGLELYDDESAIFSSEPNHNTNNRHQMCVIIGEKLEDLDESGNPVINPMNLHRGANYVAEGEDTATIAARQNFWLTEDEWAIVKAAVEGTTPLTRLHPGTY
jgi:hypothetical protein